MSCDVCMCERSEGTRLALRQIARLYEKSRASRRRQKRLYTRRNDGNNMFFPVRTTFDRGDNGYILYVQAHSHTALHITEYRDYRTTTNGLITV